MSENESKSGPGKRRVKRFLSPSQKYEIWLQLVRQEATVAEVAAAQQVDRSTIMRIKQVAKEGALASLAASKPGVKGRERDYELEQAKAEIARLSEAARSSRSSSPWWREKTVGAEWPSPAPGRCGHQGWAARSDR